MRLGRLLAALVLLASPLVRASPAPSPERLARTALAPQAATLGLVAGRDSLSAVATFGTADGGHVVRFQQLYKGVPVWRSILAVRLDAAGRLVRMTNGLAVLPELSTTPALPKEAAISTARGALPGIALTSAAEDAAALVVTRSGRLAWVVDVPAVDRTMAFDVAVDAQTGEVLSAANRARRFAAASGQANVFVDAPSAKAARRSDNAFDDSKVSQVGLAGLVDTSAGAHLTGTDIVAANCCTSEGCAAGAAPKKVDGSITIPAPFVGQATIPIHSVLCDEEQVAAADDAGNFLFEPATEPVNDTPAIPAPSETDPFSEVMVYHFAESELAYAKSLDPQFQLSTDARPLHVTANYLLPNLQEGYQQAMAAVQGGQITQLLQNGVTITTFMRFDNAAYVPKGEAERLGAIIPGFQNDHDALIVCQGRSADFGYDPDVVSHEFGHGIVEVSAGLADYAVDDQGVIDAPGAMNEGFADLWAALRADEPHIGEYVGAYEGTGEGALRDLTNDFTCPSVIKGEVHQDSQHFSAAVWAGRAAIATSDADKLKFGQAMLAGLRQLTPFSNYEDAAKAISDEVGTLFDAAAKAKMDEAFAAKKVTGCERVMDLSSATTADGYQLPGTDKTRGFAPLVPGPVQFRIAVPAGAKAIHLDAQGSVLVAGIAVPGLGGNGSKLSALAKADQQIVFSSTSSAITSDATQTIAFQGTSATIPVDGGCAGKTYFVALANGAAQGYSLDTLAVTKIDVDATKVAACSAPDAGSSPADGGSSAGSGGDAAKPGCGCTSASELAAVGLLAGALARRRRKA